VIERDSTVSKNPRLLSMNYFSSW